MIQQFNIKKEHSFKSERMLFFYVNSNMGFALVNILMARGSAEPAQS
jgi:hypothetical protein